MKYFIIGLLLLSLIGNAYLLTQVQFFSKDKSDFEALQKKYPHLSKRVLAELPQDIHINFLSLRNDLRNLGQQYGSSFALYFEYLPTGTSIGINEKDEFLAASLFKLPVVMAYYRHKERIKDESDPTIQLTENMLDDRFGTLYQKGAGYQINLGDSVKLSLQESDNTAVRSLVPQLSKEDFNGVYEGLDIDLKINNEGAMITAKQYGSILKALFFSSVLNNDHSEEIIDLLTKTKFSDKLPAGVPENIQVAHKIGVVELSDHEAYMDCGIVYVPRRPYLLCMISQTDNKTAQTRMKKVSKTVYDFVNGFKN